MTTASPSPIDRRFFLDRELLSQLAKRAPWRLLMQTAFEWVCIVVLTIAAVRIANPVVSVLCMLLIATRQHALLALMHEYAHFQLSRSRALLNDLVGDVFTAFPFFITVHGFRRNHNQHHRTTSSAQDPNWMSSLRKERFQFPMSKGRFLWEVVKHCIGCYTLEEMKGYTVDSGMALQVPRSVRISRAVYWLAILGAITWFGVWTTVLLYWVLPMATFLMAILYVRDVGEHFGMPSEGIANSRTLQANWLERLLISQNAVQYHAEHHLFPSVPFFRLEALHKTLINNPEYRRSAVVTRGYFGGMLDEISHRHAAARA